MKIFTWVIVLTSLFLHSYSQQEKNTAAISFSIGPSLPVGKYSSTNISDIKAGFASIGPALDISYSKLTSAHWGYTIRLMTELNPLNIGAMKSSLRQLRFYGLYAGPYPPTYDSYYSFNDWSVKKNTWLAATAMGGIQGRFPLSKSSKANFTTALLIGMLYAKSPNTSANATTDTTSIVMTQNSKSAIGGAYALQAGMEWPLKKNTRFLLKLEYLGSVGLSFKQVTGNSTITKGRYGTPDYTVQYSRFTMDMPQTISNLNLYFGFSFDL